MNSCVLAIKTTPSAPRDEIQGWLGDTLKIRIQAPPVDGRANAALCGFLAEALGLPRGAVRVAGGASSRLKRVAVTGMSLDEVRDHLQKGGPDARREVFP